MSIVLDTRTFGRLLDLVMPGTSPDPTETRAILQIAQLAAGVDLDEDRAENRLLGSLTLQLCAVARIPISSVPRLSPLPLDAEERNAYIAALASRLVTTRARELAYIVAYLLIISDISLAPVESELLSELQRALWIDDRQAAALTSEVSELVTPGLRGDPAGAEARA